MLAQGGVLNSSSNRSSASAATYPFSSTVDLNVLLESLIGERPGNAREDTRHDPVAGSVPVPASVRSFNPLRPTFLARIA
jgi:hypothetical protein